MKKEGKNKDAQYLTTLQGIEKSEKVCHSQLSNMYFQLQIKTVFVV
jgi:hypothetical protein